MDKVMDNELKESVLTLHEIQVQEEKDSIREATAGINSMTELYIEACSLVTDSMDLEDDIKDTLRHKRNYKCYTIVCVILSVIVAVARFMAWH